MKDWRPDAETGPTHLLVHGLASNARLWDGVASRLAALGCRSLAVDLRGHGKSDKPSAGYDFASVVGDLVDVADASQVGAVVAVGQSYGGNVVVELADRHPDRVAGVGCVDGGFITLARQFPDWATAEQALAPPQLEGLSLAEVAASMRQRLSDWPESGIEGQLANFEVRDDGTVKPWLSRANHLAILAEMWDQDPAATIGRLGQPTIIIACRGRPEKAESLARIEKSNPAVTAEWLDAHHDVHAQEPDLVVDLFGPLRNR